MARKPRPTKDIKVARDFCRSYLELKERVNQDLFAAYQVVVDTMNDPNASAATRRACASDIFSFFVKMHKDSLEILGEDDPAVQDGEDRQKPMSSSVVEFKFSK